MSGIAFTQSPGEKPFGAFYTGDESLEAVQADLVQAGSEDEKVVAYIPLDENDPGMHALAALLELAINCPDGSGDIATEELFLKVFMAGRKSAGAQD